MWILLALIILTLLVLFIDSGEERPGSFEPNQDFTEKWPPISEAEFLRRCPARVDGDRALRVRRIIANVSALPYDQIYPEQALVQDLFME